MEEAYEVSYDNDNPRGIWNAECPLCHVQRSSVTSFGAMSKLLDHMNESHKHHKKYMGH